MKWLFIPVFIALLGPAVQAAEPNPVPVKNSTMPQTPAKRVDLAPAQPARVSPGSPPMGPVSSRLAGEGVRNLPAGIALRAIDQR